MRLGRRVGDLAVLLDPRAVRDFTWTWASDLLVSPRVLHLFETHNVTGFEAKPIKVLFPEDIELPPPELYQLVVTGWGGFAAAAAGVKLIDWCPTCAKREYSIAEPGRMVDGAAWDGSDLFRV